MNFSVNVRQAEGISLVDVVGRLTSFESKAFREMIHGLLEKGQTNIVLNLTGLEYLDSSGIGGACTQLHDRHQERWRHEGRGTCTQGRGNPEGHTAVSSFSGIS